MPRRARHLIPKGLPRRREVVAVCAVAILVAHLLLAQLTLALALVFAVVSKTTRWRLWWLLAPAAAGLAWTLAAGPGNAIAGFTAGPSGILWHLGGGHLAGRAGQPLAGFSDARSWLPRQFPIALACGAVEAAVIGWLDWLRTDEWAVPQPRPGLVAAVRRALAASAIRAGTVVTRDGCALGVVPATGAIAELRWAELSCGTLVVGAPVLEVAQDVTLAGLQVVHAALRRRKPVIVLDPGGGDAAIARALSTVCIATGTPLLANCHLQGVEHAVQVADTADSGAGVRTVGAGTVRAGGAGASRLWGRGTSQERRSADPGPVDLGGVVRERSAALLPANSPELAARACGDLASLAADLHRIGVDGDALVWVPRGEQVPAQALATLVRDGTPVGLSVLIGTTSPTAAAELSGIVGTTLIHRLADPGLAASLAARTGMRLLPGPLATALAGQRPDSEHGATLPAPDAPAYQGAAVTAASAAAVDLVPSPVIPARVLLTLGPAEFVLAVSWPRQRLIAPGLIVPARLPGVASRSARLPRGPGRQAARLEGEA
ncbi:MAG: hypothetical protein JWO75_3744 [Actinomycetia bacterium]|nr:hypothetical protein [Actinomycetes bacterium]